MLLNVKKEPLSTTFDPQNTDLFVDTRYPHGNRELKYQIHTFKKEERVQLSHLVPKSEFQVLKQRNFQKFKS